MYLYVLRKMVRYLRVSTPLGISFGCAVRLLGIAAADLRVRVRLTARWLVLAVCGVLYCLMCGWLFPLGGPRASKVMCSLLAHLIAPYYTKLLVTCVCCEWFHKVWLSYLYCCVLVRYEPTHNTHK